MPTRIDIEDSYMNAKAKVAEWRRDFEANWMRKDAEQELVGVWSVLTPEEHAALKAQDPDNYEATKKLAEKLQVRHGNNPVSTQSKSASKQRY